MAVTHCCSADNTTQTPNLAFPVANTTISSNFSLDFSLPEAAASGTVKLTLTRSDGTADSGSPHIITFASAFETAAQHTMTVPPLSGAATSGYEIASISSNRGTATDLVNGATYTVRLEYQDAVSNMAASVEHSSIVVGEADRMGGMGRLVQCLVGVWEQLPFVFVRDQDALFLFVFKHVVVLHVATMSQTNPMHP